MTKPLTFAKYNTVEEAQAHSIILTKNDITNIIETENTLLDSNFIGTYYNDAVLLKIANEDFKKAQQVLFENTIINLEEVDKDYTILSFSKDELLDVIKNFDEWGIYNVKLATMLLYNMGIEINTSNIRKYQEEQIEKLSKPKQFNKLVILICNIFSILAIFAGLLSNAALIFIYSFWLLPGILGTIIGLTIYRSKVTLPNGEQVYSYNDNSRKQALLMIALNLFSILFNILVGIYRSNAVNTTYDFQPA